MTYCLAIDQSTQGTKVFVLDENAVVCHHAAVSHRQIVTGQGWVSHDLEEIYAAVHTAAAQATRHIDRGQITRIALTNQRETACLWHRDGHPLAHAVVWQCRRAQPQVDRLAGDTALASHIKAHTGLPLSPTTPGQSSPGCGSMSKVPPHCWSRAPPVWAPSTATSSTD